MDVLDTAVFIVIVSMTLVFTIISLFIFFKERSRKNHTPTEKWVRLRSRKSHETQQSRFEEIRKTLDSVDRDPTNGIG